MIRELYFIIDGPIVPKGRPRFKKIFVKNEKTKKTTSRTVAYTPKRTLDYEKKVELAYRTEYPAGLAFTNEPLEMILNVYMAIPKGVSKKKREHMLLHEYPALHNGDVDNFLKSVADALNGVCYTDDCQIVCATVNKIWSETAKAEVTIREVIK